MKHYTSIETLPIFNYFKCTEGEFKYLYKSDDYDKVPSITSELIKVWEDIQEEWNESFSSRDAKEMRMKYYKVLKLRRELVFIEGCIVLLAVKDDDDIIQELRNKRYRYNPNDKLTSLKQLNGEYLNIKRKIKEIMTELNPEDVNTNYDKYDLISGVEKFKGFQIDLYKTSTALFLAYLKEIKRENERVK